MYLEGKLVRIISMREPMFTDLGTDLWYLVGPLCEIEGIYLKIVGRPGC